MTEIIETESAKVASRIRGFNSVPVGWAKPAIGLSCTAARLALAISSLPFAASTKGWVGSDRYLFHEAGIPQNGRSTAALRELIAAGMVRRTKSGIVMTVPVEKGDEP